MISHFFAGECTERGSRVKGLRVRSDERAKNRAPLTRPPSPLLCCFQLGKNVRKKWEPGRSAKAGEMKTPSLAPSAQREAHC